MFGSEQKTRTVVYQSRDGVELSSGQKINALVSRKGFLRVIKKTVKQTGFAEKLSSPTGPPYGVSFLPEHKQYVWALRGAVHWRQTYFFLLFPKLHLICASLFPLLGRCL